MLRGADVIAIRGKMYEVERKSLPNPMVPKTMMRKWNQNAKQLNECEERNEKKRPNSTKVYKVIRQIKVLCDHR